METKPFCPPDMCRLCHELASAYDLEQTLNVLARNIAQAMGTKACSIRLLDEKNMTLEIAAAHGLSRAYLEKGPVLLEKHPVDQRVLKGECIKTRDITAEPHVIYLDEARREGIKSVLSVPLAVHDRAIGVVRVYTDEPHEFTDEEIVKVQTMASLGGILTDRARIWQQNKALIEIARSITSTLSLQEVLDKVVESAARALGLKAASIRLLDEERRTLTIKATYGLSKAYLQKGPVEVQKSPVDRQCIEGEVVAVPDISLSGELQYPEEIAREGIRSLLSIPLSVRGSVIGVLRVYTSRAYTFSDPEIEFLSALASQGATAIENARLFEHIQKEYKELTRDVWKWYDWGTHFPRI
jgi:signal transduction protein with GAF and PtsI domain